jgi:hypothetical protein
MERGWGFGVFTWRRVYDYFALSTTVRSSVLEQLFRCFVGTDEAIAADGAEDAAHGMRRESGDGGLVLRRRVEVARALAVARRPASQTPTVVEHAACPTGRSTRPRPLPRVIPK